MVYVSILTCKSLELARNLELGAQTRLEPQSFSVQNTYAPPRLRIGVVHEHVLYSLSNIKYVKLFMDGEYVCKSFGRQINKVM